MKKIMSMRFQRSFNSSNFQWLVGQDRTYRFAFNISNRTRNYYRHQKCDCSCSFILERKCRIYIYIYFYNSSWINRQLYFILNTCNISHTCMLSYEDEKTYSIVCFLFCQQSFWKLSTKKHCFQLINFRKQFMLDRFLIHL